MRIYVCDKSAREFWRSEAGDSADAYGRSSFVALNGCARSAREARSFDLTQLPIDTSHLHVLVPDKSLRICPSMFTYHTVSRELPQGAFCKVGKGLYVSSPEFCFMQAARTFSLVRLVEYADELCGTYALSNTAEIGFEGRLKPLTSRRRIEHFISRVPGIKYVAKARRAIRFVVDGSASPAETALEMMLCLPRLLGGAAVIPAKMNYEVRLPRRAAQMAGKSYYRVDLAWPEKHVGVEYNSKQYHSDDAKVTADEIRRNVLEHCGMRIIVAKPYHLYNYRGFCDLETQVFKALEMRWRPLTKEQWDARVALRKELLRRR